MKGRLGLKKPHRIARINYLPRVLGHTVALIAVFMLSRDRELGNATLITATTYFLLYPQIAWLLSCLRRDSKKAELQNVSIDSLALGIWSRALGFNLWFTFALLSSSLLNNAMIGGLQRLLLGGIYFITAGLSAYFLLNPGFHPTAGLWFTSWVIIMTMLYLASIGVTHYSQNRRLAQVNKDIAQNNQVFRALLDMGRVTYQAPSMESLIKQELDKVREIFSGEVFGIVQFHRDRPRLLHSLVSIGLSKEEQERLVETAADYNESENRDESGTLNTENSGHLWIAPMHQRLTLTSGYLVLSAGEPEERESILPLFVDQLGAALENHLLTLELRRAAETDGLTNLFNRAYLEEQLRNAIERKSWHSGMDFSVIMIDLIGLKRTNDAYGHHAGDRLIQVVAETLSDEARESDVVARFGGDEFVVLCLGCDEANAEKAFNRLGDACRRGQCRLELTDGNQLTVPVELSVGVAGSDRHPPERVLEVADARMYENKVRWYETHEQTRES